MLPNTPMDDGGANGGDGQPRSMETGSSHTDPDETSTFRQQSEVLASWHSGKIESFGFDGCSEECYEARIREFRHGCKVLSVCFAPDGRYVATGSDDNFARVFDVVSGREIMKSAEHGGWIWSVSFSPDGRSIVTSSKDKFARVFDVESGREIMKTAEHGGWIWSACFSPDGNSIATASGDAFVRIFDVKGGKEIKAMKHGGYVFAVGYSADGKNIVTACQDSFARIFDVASGQEIFKTTKHGGTFMSACFHPNGKRIATVGNDGFARIFDVASGREIMKTVEPSAGTRCICFSPAGKNIATCGADKFARVFDAASGKEVLKTMAHGDAVTKVCFSPDGQRLATSCDDNIARIFKLASAANSSKTMDHGAGVRCVCFSADGRMIATGSDDKFARIFDAASGREIMKTAEHGGLVRSLSFHPHGKLFATGSDDKFARIFDVASGEEIEKTVEHGASVFSVCFSPNGHSIATGSDDKFARIFEIGKGQEIMKTFEHEASVFSVCFSPDANCILTACQDHFARIFDVVSGEEIMKTAKHGGFVWSALFSPDGRRIVTSCSDKFARIFDVASGQEIVKTAEHGGFVWSALFSPDGNSIATACSDGYARVFTLARGGSDNCTCQNFELCMIFSADRVALSSKNFIALASGPTLRVLSCSHNFATDSWLPVCPSIVHEWAGLSQSLQKQCFISDSQIVLGEFCAPFGGHLVSLASKWLNPEVGPSALHTLVRLFQGEETVVNAGLILRELLGTCSSKDLPHAAAIEALLGNVSRHISHAARDDIFTQQLIRAAHVPSIQRVIRDFWLQKVHLVPSRPVAILNVERVTFSDRNRMYVAPSGGTDEPVFEKHFQHHPQSQGQQLDFEHLFVPFPNVSVHRDGNDPSHPHQGGYASMMLALVQLGNVDVFGTAVVRAIVHHKWQMFGFRRWARESLLFSLGLALLVLLCIRTWQSWSPENESSTSAPPADATVAALFAALCFRSAYRETAQLCYRLPGDDSALLGTIVKRARALDFWHWLNILHVVLGISASALVWARSSRALPVLAVTSFLRWWGTLFYLQAFERSGPYVRMLVEIVKAIKWFMLIMTISILAAWNAFTLLLKRRCPDDSDGTCEMPRGAETVFSAMYGMINALLFAQVDLSSMEQSDYSPLVAIIFIISMIAMPIVMLNLLIAIMGDAYQVIQDRSLRESVFMKAQILLEIELFMSGPDRKNLAFFPKFLHVIVPAGESKANSGSEYHGLMNELKKKIEDGTRDMTQSIDRLQEEIESKHQQDIAALKADIMSFKHETRAQLAEVLHLLRSKT